ncbi:Zn-dependent alcohol dehydrogenase [Novosphingobium sp. G106]|uniref:Zn-dependent alcohol dehydrogenase n=1 Tax=Novosphingobium sp. G106 TaxID=2849500 RepID=UPI001C2DDB08|nr:Zn-dependent alcohol dehydrogenase [Novosphingobium sp. G106]MBV1691265.1 Zn-dependent alcohol dehydrogenase [Novosphingobium sp. G106]
MKAAVLRERSAPLVIEDLTIAKPKGREVLVRVTAVGLCHSDMHVIDGGAPLPLPIVLGHEVAGVVEQVGADVHRLKAGDHVVVCLAFHCGHCEQCESGHSNRCLPPEAMRGESEEPRLRDAAGAAIGQFTNIGGFAEQVLVHESGCVAIRRDIPFDRAALIGCGVTTGVGAAVRSARVRPGETVAIIGCGGVGLSAINGAAIAGAGRIIAIDRLPLKLEMARRFGATDVVDASAGSVVEQVKEITGGRGVDHAIECVGRQVTIEDGFRMLGKGGTATIVGVTSRQTTIELSPLLMMLGEKRVQGSYMGGVRTLIDIPRYADLYMQGRLNLDELVSQRLTLAQINQGFADMLKGEVARSVVVFD